LGGKSTGPNPTDRAKSGTKRSLLVDGQGIPIGITVDCANRHDMKMTSGTLQSLAICRPESTLKTHQHTCVLTKDMTFLKCTNCWKTMDTSFISEREENVITN
jgi:hypothetical protein